jgi:hypothetical protein
LTKYFENEFVELNFSIRGVVGAPVMTPAVTAILENECYIQVRVRDEFCILYSMEKKKRN